MKATAAAPETTETDLHREDRTGREGEGVVVRDEAVPEEPLAVDEGDLADLALPDLFELSIPGITAPKKRMVNN